MRMLQVAIAFLLAAPLTASAEVPDRLAATWSSSGSIRAALDQEIESVVEQLSWVKRPFARKKLQASASPCERVRIWETEDGQLAIQCDEARVAIAPPDGRVIQWKNPDGETFQLSHRVDGNRVEQVFVGDKGTKRNVFELEGDRLRMHVTIESHHLPDTVDYSQSYSVA